ncbi:MAG: hypothetical protein AABZ60_06095, partial [Planctomycetota bacterium]
DHLAEKKLNPEILKAIENYAQGQWVVLLAPGSRTREIQRNFSLMLRAGKRLQKKNPQVVFVVPCAKKKLYPLLKKKLQEEQFQALLLPGYSHEAMSTARICLATSGTVTIELLYYKIPTVVLYRIGWLANKLLRFTRFLQCRWITLVNILAQEEVFPERLDSDIPTAWIEEKMASLLREGGHREKCLEKISHLHQTQIQRGASTRAASQILEHLSEIIAHQPSNDSLAFEKSDAIQASLSI